MTAENKLRQLKVLHITFNMGIGGTEQVIRQLVTNLPSEQFLNCVLCIDGRIGDIGNIIQEQGIEVLSFRRSPGFDRNLIHFIRRQIEDKHIDIVHCHQYTPWVYGFLAGFITRTRVVFTEHGRFHPDRYRYKAFLINPVMAMLTTRVIAISKATREALARYEFIPKCKIQVIYNGIRGLERDAALAAGIRKQLGIQESDFVMGTVARLDPVKNQVMMLEAFALVLQEHKQCRLLIVGDGPDRDLLIRKAHELGIQERVLFTGFKPHPAGYLAVMDIFLLSSHTEGTSMTLLEAMSLGIPTVATAVGGNPEIVEDGITGFLTPAGESTAFASAIKLLKENPERRFEMAGRCVQRFNQMFAIDTMVEAYASCYEVMCAVERF